MQFLLLKIQVGFLPQHPCYKEFGHSSILSLIFLKNEQDKKNFLQSPQGLTLSFVSQTQTFFSLHSWAELNSILWRWPPFLIPIDPKIHYPICTSDLILLFFKSLSWRMASFISKNPRRHLPFLLWQADCIMAPSDPTSCCSHSGVIPSLSVGRSCDLLLTDRMWQRWWGVPAVISVHKAVASVLLEVFLSLTLIKPAVTLGRPTWQGAEGSL